MGRRGFEEPNKRTMPSIGNTEVINRGFTGTNKSSRVLEEVVTRALEKVKFSMRQYAHQKAKEERRNGRAKRGRG